MTLRPIEHVVEAPSVEPPLSRRERLDQLKGHLREVLHLLGEDPNRDGLHRTPERWAEALMFYTQGIVQDPEDHLRVVFQLDEDDFPANCEDMVLVDNIEFTSLCEHHIAPIRGVVHVAYIPNPQRRVVTGLSKFSRVVDVFARRLQVQERMTQQIARAIDEHLNPLGILVVVEAVHYCMIQRGVQQRHSSTTTTARRGLFLERSELEDRALRYVGRRHLAR